MNLIERCKSFFGISKKEAQGFIVLQVTICIVLIIPFFTDFIFTQKKMDKSESRVSLDSLVRFFQTQSKSSTDKKDREPIPHDKFTGSFDPNIASKEVFLSTGLKPKLVERIVKFREKGGKFLGKEDLLKIYGLDNHEFEKTAPFLTFQSYSTSKAIEKKAPEVFDINKADSASLEQLKGIGPALAKRILKYKNALGGFVSKDQYSEIYGVNDNVLAQLKTYAYIDKLFEPEKINLFSADFKKIAGHPYLGYQAAKSISKLKKTGYSPETVQSLIKDDTIFKCRNSELLFRYIEIGQ